MKRICILNLFLFFMSAFIVSCNNGKVDQQTNSVEKDTIVYDTTSLDSLARLLIAEYESYDLPHFNPGVGKQSIKVEAIYCLSKEESIDYSFGILFCRLGIKSTSAALRQNDIEKLILNQSQFSRPLPCLFTDYFKNDTSTYELFLNYYEQCKETANIEYFWKFQYAFHSEAELMLSTASGDILSTASEEQYKSFVRKCQICLQALEILGRENANFSSLLEFRQSQADRYHLENNRSFLSVSEAIAGYPVYFNYFKNISHNLLTR